MNEREGTIDDERPITPQSGVRLSVGLVAGMVLAFAYFLFARDEYFAERYDLRAAVHERHVQGELANIKADIANKAEKTEAIDRFTGKDFDTYTTSESAKDEQFKESVKLWFQLIKERNDSEHEAIDRRIEHGEDDLKEAVHRIDNHYNMRFMQ